MDNNRNPTAKQNILLGIIGKRGAGKDTFALYAADALKDLGYEVRYVAFAGELKRLTGEIFGLTPDFFHSRSLKELPFNEHGSSPRFALQAIGEAVRQVDPDYWLRTLFDKITKAFDERMPGDAPVAVIITDVRYVNEYHWVHAAGGMPILIKRPGIVRQRAVDLHPSETGVDEIEEEMRHQSGVAGFHVINDSTMEDRRFAAEGIVRHITRPLNQQKAASCMAKVYSQSGEPT